MADIKKNAESRARKMIELNNHPMFMPYGRESDNHKVYVITDLTNQRVPAVPVDNGCIYVVSVQHEHFLSKPGVVTLVELEMAANCLNKGTHGIATKEQIDAAKAQEAERHREMMAREAQRRTRDINVNVQAPVDTAREKEIDDLRYEMAELRQMLAQALNVKAEPKAATTNKAKAADPKAKEPESVEVS
jgi:hypothetical protein